MFSMYYIWLTVPRNYASNVNNSVTSAGGLLEEFTLSFLPDTSAPLGAHVSSSRAVMPGREDRSSMMPSMRHPFVDRVFI